jgi:hypothetical protein
MLAVLLTALAPSPALANHRPNRYCSPTGDYCISATKEDGKRKLQVTLAAKYFDHYRLCVTAPDSTIVCHTFAIRRFGTDVYGSSISWGQHFPHKGPGAYEVNWRQGGHRLGRELGFHVTG